MAGNVIYRSFADPSDTSFMGCMVQVQCAECWYIISSFAYREAASVRSIIHLLGLQGGVENSIAPNQSLSEVL